MISVQQNHQESTEPASATRLLLKPPGGAPAVLDGGWWPRSRDPLAELPALITEVDASRGAVGRIGLSMGTWTATPRRVLADGRRVPVGWFRTWHINMLRLLIGPNLQPLQLLLVPPETSEEIATAALARAADPDNAEGWSDVLTAATAGTKTPTVSTRTLPVPDDLRDSHLHRQAGLTGQPVGTGSSEDGERGW